MPKEYDLNLIIEQMIRFLKRSATFSRSVLKRADILKSSALLNHLETRLEKHKKRHRELVSEILKKVIARVLLSTQYDNKCID